MLKIVIATPFWRSPRGGGIDAHVNGLVKTLKKNTKNIDLKIIFVDGTDSDNYQISGGRFFRVFNIFSTLRKIKPDIINVRQNWLLLFGSWIYCRFNRNVKLIYTFHTEPEFSVNRYLKFKNRVKKMIYQPALNQCDYVTLISKNLEKEYRENWGLVIKTNKVIIHAGVTARDASVQEKKDFLKKYKIKEDSIILLAQSFTASITKSEGAKILLRALKKLTKKFPKIKLILTREGAFSKALKEYAKIQGVYENTVFTGNLENPFIPLELCDVFTWPFVGTMGMGMALLEAMSVGKPIIITSATGLYEPITNGVDGMIVKPNEDDLYQGIVKLIEDKKFAGELGKNAQKTVSERFTWDISAKKYLEIYGIDHE
ncbi:MAG: glycosyltransferase family 4 protein [Candidatus Thorarchaeota archaeon]